MPAVHSCIASSPPWLPSEPSFTPEAGSWHRGPPAVFQGVWTQALHVGWFTQQYRLRPAVSILSPPKRCPQITFGSLKGWRGRENVESGWRWKVRLLNSFPNIMPTSLFSSRQIRNLAWNKCLKCQALAILTGSQFTLEGVGFVVGSFQNWALALVAELTQDSSWCWVTLVGRPGLCRHLSPREVLAIYHPSSCSQSISTSWMFLYLITCVRLLFKNPLNKVKCFHVKSFDRGMLKPDLPWDCDTKYLSASCKYGPFEVIHSNESGRWYGWPQNHCALVLECMLYPWL